MLNFSLFHPQDRPVQECILAPGEFRVETGAHLQQRADPAIEIRVTLSRISNAGENLEECALASAVAADDADDLTGFDLEGNIFDGPDGLVQIGRSAGLAAQ